MLGLSKEEQLSRSPGNRKKASAKEVGIEGEKKAISQLCTQLGRKPGEKDKRNHQGRAGGGLGVPDITVNGLDGWHIEVKETGKFSFTEFLKQLAEDCPKNKRPALIYKGWMLFKVDNLANLAQDVVLASGMDII